MMRPLTVAERSPLNQSSSGDFVPGPLTRSLAGPRDPRSALLRRSRNAAEADRVASFVVRRAEAGLWARLRLAMKQPPGTEPKQQNSDRGSKPLLRHASQNA
jgi:hypothetical protein